MLCLWFICYTDLERLEVADTAALPAPDAGRRDDGGAAELGRHYHQEHRGHQLQHRVTPRHGTSRGRTILRHTVTCHVSRLHCSRRGCGLPTGAARGKDGKSAARLASYSGGSSARALVSTPLQLWNVACLVSVWAAVVTSYQLQLQAIFNGNLGIFITPSIFNRV